MSYLRIKGIILLAWYYQKHNLEAWIDDIWWSFITVVVFGFISTLLIGERSTIAVKFILTGVILWEIVRIAQYSMSMSVLREVWSRNLSNLFTTPLSLKEIFLAQIIIGLIRVIPVFILISLIMLKVYNFSIFQLGGGLIIDIANLLVFSWAAGIFIVALIVRFGTKLQALAWSLVFILQPLCATFYPLEVLPRPLQKLAYLFPLTYIFEGARQRLLLASINWWYVFVAVWQNIIYFFVACLFLKRMFRKSKETGEFARLEG